ncbi:DUF4139 domain-containing protein [Salinisphaera sp. Q1T1-3]|uniref:DUF4139 domain-containing protein n=1 Tax=Salinisphaera sp. Q1T1-3 TaxID=2321229 RepID=UPI000E7073C1|nr:hypothetical protein [Salinisphaera sp. Q1T1-3]RJS93972.1 hypothetical protein D3260_05180 [Salinisphaera sp. Q1T1-3]
MKRIVPALTVAGLSVIAASNTALAADGGPSRDSVDAIALYSRGMAVVADDRTVDLDAGAQDIDWPVAVPPAADSLSLQGKGIRLAGFDVGAPARTDLSSRIGQPVRLQDVGGGQARQGTLVGMDGDAALVRVNDRIERVPANAPVLLSWPAGQGGTLGATPLTLHVVADQAGQADLELLYQRPAPGWQASYTGRYDARTGKLALQASAVIDNSGDTPLDADKAWLVAGEVNRAHGGGPQPMVMMAQARTKTERMGAPESAGGLYRYPLSGGLHVPAGATRGVSLLGPLTLDAKRETRFEHHAMSDSGDTRDHADLVLHAVNQSDKPLPSGAIRIYDASRQAQLMGGDQLDDTPAGAPIDLALGQAFDITGTHRVAAGDNATHKVTITLHNATDAPRTVTIAERLPSNGQLGPDAPKRSGGQPGAPEWQVKVPASGQQTFAYTFRTPSRDNG